MVGGERVIGDVIHLVVCGKGIDKCWWMRCTELWGPENGWIKERWLFCWEKVWRE